MPGRQPMLIPFPSHPDRVRADARCGQRDDLLESPSPGAAGASREGQGWNGGLGSCAGRRVAVI